MSASFPASDRAAGHVSKANGPRHVAVIMDGNGRWATQKGKPRSKGHEAGVEALRRAVEAAGDLGLEYLTVYAFSTENWSRPEREVNFLMTLLKLYVKRDVARLNREGVRVRMIGNRSNLGTDILNLILDAERKTEANQRLNLNIAFNYGSREEILSAARLVAENVAAGKLLASDVDQSVFSQFLYTNTQPDPDLIIRTSGEQRLSNFLLWQGAYAELLFMDVLWPDFGHEHLETAIEAYRSRERRFGGVEAGST